jgi:hypothetical protein
MSVPLDRLYQYIENIANRVYGNSVIIYRFWPHGSKKPENLGPMKEFDWLSHISMPTIVCHDQEPLNFDFYNRPPKNDPLTKLLFEHGCYQPVNLLRPGLSIFDKTIIVHSEINSQEVLKYQANNFLPVYYWSHALISLDWFRYAQHINQNKNAENLFLIYNRAWSGTREYRIKFVEHIINQNLQAHCRMKFNSVDPDTNTHYQDYGFSDTNWKPCIDIQNIFEINDSPGHYSADFEIADYEATDVEVVLETIFSDQRIHLTEKTLRPIACQQPFILVSSAGSLEYLKSYGFKTFSEIWDESYDQIQDPVQRLESIATLMKTISQWNDTTKKAKLAQAQQIANFNKKHFFSKSFFKKIKNELSTNLQKQLTELVDKNTAERWLNQRKLWSKHEPIKKIITGKTPLSSIGYPNSNNMFWSTIFKTSEVIKALKLARKYYERHHKNK